MSPQPKILVIDDEPDMLDNCNLMLGREGYDVRTLLDGRELGACLSAYDPDLVLTDLMIPHKDGMAILEELRYSHPDVPVLMMTAYATIETAVDAMKLGAADYIVKPFSQDQLILLVRRVLKERNLVLENRRLRLELERQSLTGRLVAADPAMQNVLGIVARVADTDVSVMIQGESGTGKEVIARAIHESSRRGGHPFVAVNCSALPSQLMESELFGHEKGAFTGAVAARKGLLDEAHGGTFFFDEVTEMDSGMQAKLLRVVQERTVRRVGGNRESPFDVRILSATNRPIQEAIKTQRFREDLFFRLAVVNLVIPPLRSRRADIPVLAVRFLAEVCKAFGRKVDEFSPQVMDRLMDYPWPGNVRELRNVVEHAVSMAMTAIIRESDLPETLQKAHIRKLVVSSTESYETAKNKVVDDFQRAYFDQIYGEERGNISRVAARAGVDRKTVYRIMRSYGMLRKDQDEE
ncbi:sigma-54-dependent Fis family transcriptional regulator [candidate division KSB1 bacterium]|nr:sigma-54-dependent Fis family transcriptional regulator [candidate division KSB1 bacterium]